MSESAEQMAERYGRAFIGNNAEAIVQRDRLVEMVANAVKEGQVACLR